MSVTGGRNLGKTRATVVTRLRVFYSYRVNIAIRIVSTHMGVSPQPRLQDAWSFAWERGLIIGDLVSYSGPYPHLLSRATM